MLLKINSHILWNHQPTWNICTIEVQNKQIVICKSIPKLLKVLKWLAQLNVNGRDLMLTLAYQILLKINEKSCGKKMSLSNDWLIILLPLTPWIFWCLYESPISFNSPITQVFMWSSKLQIACVADSQLGFSLVLLSDRWYIPW